MTLLAVFVLASVILLIWLLARDKPQDSENEPHSTNTADQLSPPTPLGLQDIRRALAPFAMIVYRKNEHWLNARWSKAQTQRTSAVKDGSFPDWYFDEITERQRVRLTDDGFTLPLNSLTKGHASDLIGLLEPPADEDADVLRFFKAPPEVSNKTRARGEVERLFEDPAALVKWNSHPADSLQKETLRCYGIKIPNGLTVTDAQALIGSTESTLNCNNQALVLETRAYISIVMALCGPEVCKTNGIKLPPLAAIRAAVAELRDEGQDIYHLADNLFAVAEKLTEMKPELRRRSNRWPK